MSTRLSRFEIRRKLGCSYGLVRRYEAKGAFGEGVFEPVSEDHPPRWTFDAEKVEKFASTFQLNKARSHKKAKNADGLSTQRRRAVAKLVLEGKPPAEIVALTGAPEEAVARMAIVGSMATNAQLVAFRKQEAAARRLERSASWHERRDERRRELMLIAHNTLLASGSERDERR